MDLVHRVLNAPEEIDDWRDAARSLAEAIVEMLGKIDSDRPIDPEVLLQAAPPRVVALVSEPAGRAIAETVVLLDDGSIFEYNLGREQWLRLTPRIETEDLLR